MQNISVLEHITTFLPDDIHLIDSKADDTDMAISSSVLSSNVQKLILYFVNYEEAFERVRHYDWFI